MKVRILFAVVMLVALLGCLHPLPNPIHSY